MELEAAFRSKELSGFQILDLQDFTGQGTAVVGNVCTLITLIDLLNNIKEITI